MGCMMKCTKYEKWISDALDGVLLGKKTRRLESHLARCSSCRNQRESLLRLQHLTLRLAGTQVSPGYWEDFSARIERRLRSRTEGPNRRMSYRRAWQWAWTAAAAVVFSVLGFMLVTNRRPALQHEIFSYEECLSRLSQQIGDDSDLASNFNLVLWESIGESLGDSDLEERPRFSEDPFFWEGLGEKEWEAIAREIQKKMTI